MSPRVGAPAAIRLCAARLMGEMEQSESAPSLVTARARTQQQRVRALAMILPGAAQGGGGVEKVVGVDPKP